MGDIPRHSLLGALAAILELGGAGVAIVHPSWSFVGYLLIAAGFVPLATLAWDRFGAPSPRTGPKRGWVPIAKAPFAIRRHPEFEHDTDGPNPAFLPIRFMVQTLSNGSIDLPAPPGMTFNPGVPSMRKADGADLTYCGIDWDKQAFCWRWGPAGRSLGISLEPWEVAKFPLESFLSEETARIIRAKASSVWSLMQHPISTFLSEGRLVIWARIAVATVHFSVIPPDTWQHFQIADWPTGRAETAKGEALYSVHVEVVRKRVSRVADGFHWLQSLLARLTRTMSETRPG